MKRKINNLGDTKKGVDQSKTDPEGYPHYPASEDIYATDKEEIDLDPEEPTKHKTPVEKDRKLNEKDFREDLSGSDLDIPGSELDDEEERIGNEDEENNYYSLGGDDHNDLEEDQGDDDDTDEDE